MSTENRISYGPMLGSGNFTALYKARCSVRGEYLVAVKVLHKKKEDGYFERKQKWEQLVSEAHLMLSLSHPNIQPLLAVSRGINSLTLITKFVELGSLLEFVQDNREELETAKLISWSKQVINEL